jgi:hypothetical protein
MRFGGWYIARILSVAGSSLTIIYTLRVALFYSFIRSASFLCSILAVGYKFRDADLSSLKATFWVVWSFHTTQSHWSLASRNISPVASIFSYQESDSMRWGPLEFAYGWLNCSLISATKTCYFLLLYPLTMSSTYRPPGGLGTCATMLELYHRCAKRTSDRCADSISDMWKLQDKLAQTGLQDYWCCCCKW